YAEPLGDMATRRAVRIKSFFVGTAIALDFAIVLLLRGEPGINFDAIRLFAYVNIPLLSLDLLCGELAIRFARTQRAWRAVLDLTALILAFTTVLWIQLTGSLTSYFLLCSTGLIITTRLAFDYRMSALSTMSYIVLHSSVVFAERLGWLR